MAQGNQPRIPGPEGAAREESGFNALAAAALFGGAMAAGAGAYFGTRALARRNRETNGRPINSVMAAAITACDLAHDKEHKGAETHPSSADPMP